VLLNTARGPLVEEQAVADALGSGRLGGFGADVSAVEPMDPNCPLLGAPNCVMTPHIAWASRAARQRLMGQAEENLAAFLRGEGRNRVV
ncbi:MAG: D-2-hydroxyacid dehydrogenase, partial [Oscillospiraceae bacterium]|nr:D-2-hydroxyacid dehydrogenase [Oscillospiraceae bacterium]